MPEEKIADWIRNHREQGDKGERTVFAITLKKSGALLGSIDLTFHEEEHDRAEMGYWIGEPHREQGFCTEAGQAVLEYAFKELDLKAVFADFYTWNVASGRVMQKLGMNYEKTYDKFAEQWNTFMEVDRYIIYKGEKQE